MKKLLALLLALMMVLTLAACGAKTPDADTPDVPKDETEAPVEGTTDEIVYPEGVTDMTIEEDGFKSFAYNDITLNSYHLEAWKSGEGDYAADNTLGDMRATLGGFEKVWPKFQQLIDDGVCTEDTMFGDAEAMLYGFTDLNDMIAFTEGVFATMDTDPTLKPAA